MTTPRICPSCGVQVAAGERFCANCGTRMPDQATPVGGQPAVEPTIFLPPTPVPGQSPTPLPGVSPQGPMQLPPDTPAAPPPAARRGLPLWAIILLGLAGLCVVGCIATFAIVSIAGQQVSSEILGTVESSLSTAEVAITSEGGSGIDPTDDTGAGGIVPTLEDIPTRPPETTVEAAPTTEQAPTTGGGGGLIGGGPDVSAAQVQTVQAVTTEALAATAEIEQVYGAGQVVFEDEFVDNRNAWFTGVFQEVETDKIEDGVFKVIWSGSGSSYELYEVRELTNFVAEVDCLILSGGVDASCGLIFGQRVDVGFYKFELFEDYYRLFTVQAEGDPPILAEGNPEGVVQPGGVNRLRVIKQGDRMRIYLNQVLLADVSDSTYPTGKIGVSTNSYLDAGGVEVHFDNIVIRELP